MIVIRAELWPNGDKNQSKHLGTAKIINDNTGNLSMGNYKILLSGKNSKQIWRAGAIKGFPRKVLGHWDLLYRALKELVGERN